jgi:NAD(P)-dependent dehydrogenase (short-subunit alcohol dehydrogenase family)
VFQFKQQGDSGVILNTGSVAGIVGWGGSAYGTSKAGVNHLTRAIAIECAADGIRANAIGPARMPGTNFLAREATEGSVGVGEDIARAVGSSLVPEDNIF